MSSIQASVKELKEINIEIKRLRTETSKLRKRATEIEKNIITYLNEKEQPGVKYQNTAIILENKPKRVAKSKKEVENDSLKILENCGIHNAKEVLNQILESRKGDKVQLQKVKIQKIENRI